MPDMSLDGSNAYLHCAILLCGSRGGWCRGICCPVRRCLNNGLLLLLLMHALHMKLDHRAKAFEAPYVKAGRIVATRTVHVKPA